MGQPAGPVRSLAAITLLKYQQPLQNLNVDRFTTKSTGRSTLHDFDFGCLILPSSGVRTPGTVVLEVFLSQGWDH